MMMMMVRCHAMSMPVDDDVRRGSSNSGGTACCAMGSSHPHMHMVRCNAMAWTDEKEEGGRLKVLVTSSDPVAGTTVVTEKKAIPRAADEDRRQEALHGAREAVAGDAARSCAQEPPHS